MSKVQIEKVLGFTRAEERVWSVLSTEGSSIAELARASRLPRMTVHKIVHRFIERGLVRKKKRGKRYEYHCADTSAMSDQSSEEIQIHRGRQAMLARLRELASVKRARWSLMQSTENARQIIEKVPRAEIEALNRTIADNGQITDLYVEEGYLDGVSRGYTASERHEWQASLKRMAVVYILPKGTLTARTDLVVQHGRAFLIDWSAEVMFEISHRETVRMYESFLEMLAASVPKRTNMHAYIAEGDRAVRASGR